MLIQELERSGGFKAARIGSQDIGDAIKCLHARGRGGNHQEPAAGDGGLQGNRVLQIVGHNLVATDIMEPRVGIVELDELNVVTVSAGRRLVHNLGYGDGRFAAGRPKGIVRVIEGADGDTRLDVCKIPKLGRGPLAGIVAASSNANVNQIGHGDRGAAQRCPVEAIVTGVAGKTCAHALQPQPSIGIVNREPPLRNGGPADGAAILKESAV